MLSIGGGGAGCIAALWERRRSLSYVVMPGQLQESMVAALCGSLLIRSTVSAEARRRVISSCRAASWARAGAEAGELVDRDGGLGEALYQRCDLVVETGHLGVAWVGLLRWGACRRRSNSARRWAEGRVAAVARGAVDAGLRGEGPDVASAAGWELIAQEPVDGGAGSDCRWWLAGRRRFACHSRSLAFRRRRWRPM